MEGEDKGAIRVMDDLAELLDRVTSDAEVVQQPAVEEKGRERWFPLGRDALVSSTPQTLARAHELESDTYRGFPDKVEGDSEEDAIHGQDVYVRTESADLSSSDLVSVPHDDDSGDNLFHDDLVAQSTEQAAPREHRLHTDYDIQGLFSDVKIPSEDYLSNLGEDGQPYGIRDRALTLRDIQAERVANSFYRVDPDKSLDDYVPEH
ncbi:hypothetical protein GUITHDRAFT_151754 [Guillardia theta CCMP2712]|uniref:Uncharacterized protein n=2 Tax=Guillardia theta TaxID=55529 RepID=L1JIW1_GUITC|nr:hypothetical protein GUITHDRAFT_151754 [Guillardia theta CCMP2712]EKX48458.1 hypothetical protein GUITHDRAFT_151754 [Guillardia theta CCMP2712]|eukprot:XP_005835438.1 hypothetical protein GUITHDRAFT_151754 [Guillardia theta CCMP2712]